MKYLVNALIIIIIVLSIVVIPSSTAQAATYTVTNVNDSGVDSLRWAIEQAKTNPGADRIDFNIPAHLCDAVTNICTISLNSALPSISGPNSNGTFIDGYSQTGAEPATDDNTAAIKIEIDGTSTGNSYGIVIRSNGNLIQGLAIINFGFDGICLDGATAFQNTVQGNYLGLDASGNAAGNLYTGVYIKSKANNNMIGGDLVAERNIISGNGQSGIEIYDVDTDDNYIMGNYIGTTPDGMSALSNGTQGVLIKRGAKNNIILENIISANQFGVVISSNVGDLNSTSDNIIESNGIGIAVDLSPLGNSEDGVLISYIGQDNQIIANYIAYNGSDGVQVDTPTAFNNTIGYNIIHDNDELGINLTNGANHNINPPVLNEFHMDSFSISGAACPSCYVQLFASRTDDGEGERIIGEGNAGAAGDFAIQIFQLPYPYITATATNLDDDDGTSEFSEVFVWSLNFIPLTLK